MKLLDYIKGNRKGKAAHRTELEAMNDPFLAEALEGFDAVDGRHDEVIARLQGRVTARAAARPKRRLRYWGVAAVVVLFLGLGGVYLGLMRNRPDVLPEVLAEVQSEAPKAASDSTAVIAQAEETRSRAVELEQAAPEAPVLREQEQVTADILNIVQNDEKIVVDETAFADFDAEPEVMMAPAPVAAKEEAVEEDIPYRIAPSVSQATKAEVRVQASRSAGGTNSITGRVVDEHGEPLIGVAVAVKGTSNGAISDMNGAFRIDNVEGTPELVASYLGYEPAQIADYRLDNPVTIAMNEDKQTLEEVVVIGYGTARKRDSQASAEALQGQVAGVELNRQADLPPQPVDGFDSFREYVKRHRIAQAASGRVVLEFRINRRGRPQNIRVKEGLSEEADREAVRLLEGGPDWMPVGQTATVNVDF